MIPGIRIGKIKIRDWEDSLTSAVFQLLFYLPQPIFTKILAQTLESSLTPDSFLNLEQIDYWPKWDSSYSGNKRYVEPDIFISFKQFDLIVEAKRWEESGQYEDQWKKEIITYHNEYGINEKRIFLWALGGNPNLENKNIYIDDLPNDKKIAIPIIRTTWTKLLTVIKSSRKNYNKESNSEFKGPVNRIFDDLLYSFELHGFFAGTWFNEHENEFRSSGNFSSSYFTKQNEKYDSQKWFKTLSPINFNIHSLNYFYDTKFR